MLAKQKKGGRQGGREGGSGSSSRRNRMAVEGRGGREKQGKEREAPLREGGRLRGTHSTEEHIL